MAERAVTKLWRFPSSASRALRSDIASLADARFVATGEPKISERRLADELKARGFTKKKTRGSMVWHGIGLRVAE